MTAFVETYAIVILLALFVGVLFWAFKARKKALKQQDKEISSEINSLK